MKPVSETMRDSLSKNPATLCYCWIIKRTDGVAFGFTEHDRTIALHGIACEPQTGLTPGDFEQSAGLPGDSSEVSGIISSDRIRETDLHSGLYDGAIIERYLVDWKTPDANMVLGRSIIGEVTTDGDRFSAELRSASSLLDRNATRYFSRLCSAELGDQQCGIDLAQPTLHTRCSVVSMIGLRLTLDGAIEPISDYRLGSIRRAFEPEKGARIAAIQTSQNTTTIDLEPGHQLSVKEGDELIVTVGCDKRFATCCHRFDNAHAFRGFPHIPGTTTALEYADEEGTFDGSPLVP